MSGLLNKGGGLDERGALRSVPILFPFGAAPHLLIERHTQPGAPPASRMIQDHQQILYPWSPRSAPSPQGWCLVARYAQNKGYVCANTSATVLCDHGATLFAIRISSDN